MLRPVPCAALLFGILCSCASAQEGPQLLFVTARDGHPEIVLKKPDADPAILGSHEASEIFPYWSRNGKRVAYCSNRTGRFQVYSMDSVGADHLQVSLERSGDALCPSWSPTGEHLVYQHGADHQWQLVVITADGAEWRPIVKHAKQPDWSPAREKGDRIVFVGAEHDAGQFLYTCEPSGIDIQRIYKLSNRIGFVHPIWSPDAALIAFTDRVNNSHEIMVCGPEGQNARVLTKLGGKCVYPTWSPDGKRVYFLHQRPDHLWRTMSVDVETREVVAVDVIPVEGFILGKRASLY